MERDKFFKFLFYLYLFLSLSFLILKIDPLINNVRVFVSYLFDPSFSVGTINKFKDINYKIRSLLETEINNIKLQEENKMLKARLMDFERLEKENLELKEILKETNGKIDAFIAGLPVIVTDWHLNSEIIMDHYNGLLIDISFESLSEKMKYLILNKEEINKMSFNCLDCALKYDYQNVLSHIEL